MTQISIKTRAPDPPYVRADGSWVVTRYDDVNTVLRSPLTKVLEPGRLVAKVSQRLGGRYDDYASLLLRCPIFLNGADHAAARQASREAVSALAALAAGGELERRAEALAASLVADIEFDAMAGLAHALSDQLLAEFLGLEACNVTAIRLKGQDFFAGVKAVPKAAEMAAHQDFCAGLRRELSAGWQRRTGTSPLLEGLGTAGRDALFFTMIAAANETQSDFAGNVINLLAGNHGLQEVLREDPAKIAAFIEEALRLVAPVRLVSRVIVGGTLALPDGDLPDGTFVIVNIEAANRDPAHYADPEAFRIGRSGPPPLAFAAGPHACLGMQLAKQMARVLTVALLRRWRVFPGAAAPQALRRSELRGFSSLPVRVSDVC